MFFFRHPAPCTLLLHPGCPSKNGRSGNIPNPICTQSLDLSGIDRGIDPDLTRARGTDRARAGSVVATGRAPNDAVATRDPDPDRAAEEAAAAAAAAEANPEGADPGAKAATEVERRGPPGGCPARPVI